ncbi:MAG TPA: hypothetical protein VIL48_02585 [Acidimicrobiales bacterium]
MVLAVALGLQAVATGVVAVAAGWRLHRLGRPVVRPPPAAAVRSPFPAASGVAGTA